MALGEVNLYGTPHPQFIGVLGCALTILRFAEAGDGADVVTPLDEVALTDDASLQLVTADEILLGSSLASNVLHSSSIGGDSIRPIALILLV
jgi:hypothetical protein